jgi:hypothetical protein
MNFNIFFCSSMYCSMGVLDGIWMLGHGGSEANVRAKQELRVVLQPNIWSIRIVSGTEY